MSTAGNGFVEGLEHGVVRLRACGECGFRQTLDPIVCAACGSRAMEWRETRARGRVHSLSEVHRAPTPAFHALVPYVLVLVDLDGGGRLMGHGEAGLAIGTAVEATVVDIAGLPLIRFVAVRDQR